MPYFGCKRKQWRYANDRRQGAWKPLHYEAEAAQVRTRMRVAVQQSQDPAAVPD